MWSAANRIWTRQPPLAPAGTTENSNIILRHGIQAKKDQPGVRAGVTKMTLKGAINAKQGNAIIRTCRACGWRVP
jgi:hypothetical protein